MVVWQFTTIAALIGALLICVLVLTNRLATTNALLKRIEEGLVRPQPVIENVPAREVEIAPVSAPVPTSAAAEVGAEEASAAEAPERDRRVSYLTVRDLKVIARSGRRSSDTPVGVSPLFNEVFGRKHAQAEPAESPGESPVEAVPHLEVVAVDEPVLASLETPAVVEELAAATYEMRDFLEMPLSPPSPVVNPVPEPVAVDVAAFEPVTTEPTSFESVTTEPAALEPSPTERAAFEGVPAEPAAFEGVSADAVSLERVTTEAVAFEHAPRETAVFERATTGSVAFEPAITEIATAEPVEVLQLVAVISEQPVVSHLDAAKVSAPDDAAARDEKRKRDLLMHAYRRRRHQR